MNSGVVSLYMAGEIVVRKPFGLTPEDLLSILIVPVALAGVGYLFTWWQKNRDLAVEAQRLKNAQELEQQRAQDEVFQAYLDQLAEPLISGQLHEAGRFDSMRVLARARTVGVLWKLDPNARGASCNRVYTRIGIEWVNDTDMSTVLLRHYPALAPALRGVKNAFWPWKRVGS